MTGSTIHISVVSAALAATSMLSAPAQVGAATAKQAFNVVIISADAMRADALGANGSDVKTPHLDALAAQGTNFTRAYTSVTTTTPSHASIFSSLYAMDHKAYSNTARISDEIVTLPELLKQGGWHTAAIVNMRWLNPEVSNIPQGIDELARCQRTRRADRTNRWVLDFLDRRRAAPEPFFLWIHYIDTHTPYHAPGDYARQYYPAGRDPRSPKWTSMADVWKLFPKEQRENEYTKKWLGGITDSEYVRATYRGSVTWLDAHVGEVIARLKKNGQWDRTLFVFTSDHGESLGEHGIWFEHAGLYEDTARVPLVVRTPGGAGGGQVARIVRHVDIMPTVLAQVGLPVPNGVRGVDLLTPPPKDHPTAGVALLEHAGNNLIGVVVEQYKYVRHLKTKRLLPAYRFRKGSEELYDLVADPDEARNLAAERPEVVKAMRGHLDRLTAKQTSFGGNQADIDEQTLEQLRSLGYIQ